MVGAKERRNIDIREMRKGEERHWKLGESIMKRVAGKRNAIR